MKRIIFIISAAAIILSINSCKNTKQAATIDSKKRASENVENQQFAGINKNLVEKYWKLIELQGNSILYPAENAKDVHITFRVKDYQFDGNAGCNIVAGNYQLQGPDRITISPKISTMKMCLDMEIEAKFLKMLETVDSYAVRNDTLSLHRARMAPLARFVAVYMK